MRKRIIVLVLCLVVAVATLGFQLWWDDATLLRFQPYYCEDTSATYYFASARIDVSPSTWLWVHAAAGLVCLMYLLVSLTLAGKLIHKIRAERKAHHAPQSQNDIPV
ncbi:MAG: hypothetical protein FWD06_04705 [Oscillospiraceae bacterium]|nr:hypothetical protein [Oscillospiraceae bacterium]